MAQTMTTAEFLDETVKIVRDSSTIKWVVFSPDETPEFQWVDFHQGGTFKVRVLMDDATCHVILMTCNEVEHGRSTFTGSLNTPYFVAGAVNSLLY